MQNPKIEFPSPDIIEVDINESSSASTSTSHSATYNIDSSDIMHNSNNNNHNNHSHRAQLPGQRHPGLGVGNNIHDLLVFLSKSKKRDGLLNVPEHFHNGYLYILKGYYF